MKGPGEFDLKLEDLSKDEIRFLQTCPEVKPIDEEAKKLIGVKKHEEKTQNVLKHTGTAPPKEQIKEDILPNKFICKECGRNFPTQNALNAHRTHCKGASGELDEV